MRKKSRVGNGFERKLVVTDDFLSTTADQLIRSVPRSVAARSGRSLFGHHRRQGGARLHHQDRAAWRYASITTIEGSGNQANLHPLQIAWVASVAAQCGFCSPGFSSPPRPFGRDPTPPREVPTGSRNTRRSAAAPASSPGQRRHGRRKVLRGEMTLDINHTARRRQHFRCARPGPSVWPRAWANGCSATTRSSCCPGHAAHGHCRSARLPPQSGHRIRRALRARCTLRLLGQESGQKPPPSPAYTFPPTRVTVGIARSCATPGVPVRRRHRPGRADYEANARAPPRS